MADETIIKPSIRKTWIMLKKAVKFLDFSKQSEVVPTFNGGATASNKFGTWTATNSKIIDDEYYNLSLGSNYKKNYIDLILPDKVFIKPKIFRTRGEDMYCYIYGYDPKLEEWVYLGRNYHPNHTSSSSYYTKTLTVSTDTFFSKIRFIATGNSKYNTGEITSAQVVSGTIKF